MLVNNLMNNTNESVILFSTSAGGVFMKTEDTFDQLIGKKVREARKLKGLTQERLAEQLSLSRTSIANIERGKQKLSLYYLYVIANKLDVDASELLIPMSDFNSQFVDNSRSNSLLNELLDRY